MKLTARDLRAIELIKKYESNNVSEHLKEYYFLIDTLIYIHESISEEKVKIKYWQKFSETLLYKFYYHGLTIHSILSGIKLHSTYYKEEISGKLMIDILSAKSVLRSQFEAFLMYHHIYVNPNNDDLKELRYNAWIYSSLMQRQKFPAQSEYAKKQKAKDQIELEKIKATIINLESYKGLSLKQQNHLLNLGSSKLFNHWSTILKETGIIEESALYHLYTFLSIHSHSEGLSIIQLDSITGGLENIAQAKLDLHHSKLLICRMINSIIKLFDVAKDRYEKLSDDTKYDIEFYTSLTAK